MGKKKDALRMEVDARMREIIRRGQEISDLREMNSNQADEIMERGERIKRQLEAIKGQGDSIATLMQELAQANGSRAELKAEIVDLGGGAMEELRASLRAESARAEESGNLYDDLVDKFDELCLDHDKEFRRAEKEEKIGNALRTELEAFARALGEGEDKANREHARAEHMAGEVGRLEQTIAYLKKERMNSTNALRLARDQRDARELQCHAAAVRAEREACATIASDTQRRAQDMLHGLLGDSHSAGRKCAAEDIAAWIRARGAS